jgi:hypothetical protein
MALLCKSCAWTVNIVSDSVTQTVITSPDATIGLCVAVTVQTLETGTTTVVVPMPMEKDGIAHVNSQGTPEETGDVDGDIHAL